MQRQRSAIGSFPESIEIDQGPVSNNADISQQTSLNNMLMPEESRLSNTAVSSGEASCVNPDTHDVLNFSIWTSGASSSMLGSQNQVRNDGIKMEERWSPALNAHTLVGPGSEQRQFEPSNILFPGRVTNANQVRRGPISLQDSSCNHVAPNLIGDSDDNGNSTVAVLAPNHFNSVGLEIERTVPSGSSSDTIGTSSGSSSYIVEETNGGSGSSLGGWGLSCKRKALEGTSGQSYPGGNSSSVPQPGNGAWHTGPAHLDASGSFNLSAPLRSYPVVAPPEQVNPIIGSGAGVTSDVFPSSGFSGTADPLRNFGGRGNAGHQPEAVTLNLSTPSDGRHSNIWSQHSPIPAPLSESLDLTSTVAANSSTGQTRPHSTQRSALRRNMHHFPWNGSSNSRSESSSGSFIPRTRVAALREVVNLRRMRMNSAENPISVPGNEIRSVAQDPAGWRLATGNLSTLSSAPSTRIGSSSTVHPLPAPAWISQQHFAAHNQQTSSEFPLWSPFPSADSDSDNRSSHFQSSFSGPSASAQESVLSSGSSSQGHYQPFSRSFLMEGQSDNVMGMPRSLRALAADIEGRHQLISEIRQVLNAMRRGETLRFEDYMLFDPFIYHGMAEIHDRHRDMRLDVDNMSYEELLALEERIGDVSTGLSEENILKLMKQQKHTSITAESPAELKPCCICQEEYVDGDEQGKLDCGHDFHTNCIKQWLMHKNLCPICKMTALLT